MHRLENLLRKLLPYHWGALLRTIYILRWGYGLGRSAREWSSVDRHGRPLPWYTFPAIEYLDQLDFRDRTVFEYGAGNSTLFWAAAAKRVISVEDSPEWYEKVRCRLPANASLRLERDLERYVRTIDDPAGPFDVIVVDGKRRFECTRQAVGRLNAGGLIILDNADQYPKSAALLRDAGLIEIDMSGFGPIGGHTWTTSLFLHRQFNLAPRHAVQPVHGIGNIPVEDEE